MDEMNNTRLEQTPAEVPGKGPATASMVLGIIAVALWFFGYTAIISVVLGIIGLILAGKSKKAGFTGGTRTAGFVLSLIGLIGGGIAFAACVACAGALTSAATAGALEEALNSL